MALWGEREPDSKDDRQKFGKLEFFSLLLLSAFGKDLERKIRKKGGTEREKEKKKTRRKTRSHHSILQIM